jgi:hypothetical protein
MDYVYWFARHYTLGQYPKYRRKMYSYDAFASPEDSKSIQERYGTR